MNIKSIPCGRLGQGANLCCLNRDITWKSNKLYITKVEFYLKESPHINVYYEVRCRKCGHIRRCENHLDFNVIRGLFTGKIYF